MAQSQAIYRRWRPRKFSDVVGQDHVTRTLRNAVRLNRVAHGYLFCGPRGVAKTSTARILAKAINCLNSTTGEPCDECAMCVSIAGGHSYDVLEMDAASNGLVDNVRELRQNVMTHPDQARRKIYILDEAHRMSAPAFDALLKTLEEPPDHVVFILITSEPDKIPGTIVSRCQRFDFRRLAQRGIVGRLEEICQAETISVEPAALEMIARASTGSMRDAQSLLDQLVALGGTSIEASDVAAVLGTAGDAAAATLADQVIRRDIPGGLRLINQVVADGADPRQFCRDVTDYLRGLLMLKLGGPDEADNVSAETRARMTETSQLAQVDHLLRAVKLFGLADSGWRGTLHFQLPIELAFVEATLDSPLASSTASAPIANPSTSVASRTATGRPTSLEVPKTSQPGPLPPVRSADAGLVAKAPARTPVPGETSLVVQSKNPPLSAGSPADPDLISEEVRNSSLSVPSALSVPNDARSIDRVMDGGVDTGRRISEQTDPMPSVIDGLQKSNNVDLANLAGQASDSPGSTARGDDDLQAHWQYLVEELRSLGARQRLLFPDAVRLRGLSGDRVVLEVRDKWASDQLNDRELRISVIDALERFLGFAPRLDPVLARPNQWETKPKDGSSAIAEKVIREAAKFGWRGSIVPREETK